MNPPRSVDPAAIHEAHRIYCSLTGQQLGLGYDRERMWFELLRAGHSTDDLRHLVVYLQREIRAGRRNVGALKLSNLLQPDRFEEDLAISRVALRAPTPTASAGPAGSRSLPAPEQLRQRREQGLQLLRDLRQRLG
jgi:hypothetical protein